MMHKRWGVSCLPGSGSGSSLQEKDADGEKTNKTGKNEMTP